MADVRLTATNPEDSSVVPVACDASGRLLLEEPQVVVGPPGPEGPPGPKGDDGKDGDPFSGNFADDVTFGGSARFAGDLQIENTPSPTIRIIGTGQGTALFGQGLSTYLNRGAIIASDNGPIVFRRGVFFDRDPGDAENGTTSAMFHQDSGDLLIGGDLDADVNNRLILLKGLDGSATFAGGKAGFTAEGYLWCTTRRGDTVILDATSNGLGSWVEYTPTSRIDDLRDKLDANRPETGEMPADTP